MDQDPSQPGKYRSRKFGLAAFSLLFSALGLGLGWIDGGTWVAAMALVLGLYSAANVTEGKK